MKTGFAVCIVFVTFASVQGASLRKSWYDLLPSIPQTENRVGDIWTNCGKAGDPVKINKVTITPDPPEKGKSLTVDANITLSEEVTKGDIKLTIKYGIIPIISMDLQLCDEVKAIGLQCPLEPKTYDGKLSVDIPSAIPGGHYSGNVEVTDQNGKELSCIDLDLHF